MGTKKEENIHAGHRHRQRDRIKHSGHVVLHDHEALENLLTYAIPRIDTNPLAHALMDRFGSIAGVFEADQTELQKVNGIGENTALLLRSIPDLFRRYLLAKQKEHKSPVPTSYDEVVSLVQPHLIGVNQERFYLMSFDNRGRVIDLFLVREGSVNQVSIDNRRLISRVCAIGAASVMLFHNHPNGTPEPSDDDIRCTETIKNTLSSIGVFLQDHLVISGTEFQSILFPFLTKPGHNSVPILLAPIPEPFCAPAAPSSDS